MVKPTDKHLKALSKLIQNVLTNKSKHEIYETPIGYITIEVHNDAVHIVLTNAINLYGYTYGEILNTFGIISREEEIEQVIENIQTYFTELKGH